MNQQEQGSQQFYDQQQEEYSRNSLPNKGPGQSQNIYQTFQNDPNFEGVIEEDEDYENVQQQGLYAPQMTQQSAQKSMQHSVQQSVNFGDYTYIRCPTHPQSVITQICMNTECNEPLCSECVIKHRKYHQELHTPIDIQNITQVRVECLDGVNQLINIYSEKQRPTQRQTEEQQEINGYSIQNLLETKLEVLKVIENYFNELERQIDHGQGILSQQQFEDYKETKSKLESNLYIQAIIEVLENQDQQNKYIEQIEKLNELDKKQPKQKEIKINVSKIYALRKELGDLIYLEDVSGKQEIQDKDQIEQRKKKIFDNMQNSRLPSQRTGNNLQNTMHYIQQNGGDTQPNHQAQKSNLAQTTPANNIIPITQQGSVLSTSKNHYTRKAQPNQQPQQKQSLLKASKNYNSSHQSSIHNKAQQIKPIQAQPHYQPSQKYEKLPNHQVRLSQLNSIEDKLNRLSNRINKNLTQNNFKFTEGTSASKPNNEDQNDKILKDIAQKYDIPLNNPSYYGQEGSNYKDVLISGPEDFEMNKIIHYFQENSKKLYMVDCSRTLISFDDINLRTEDFDFKVPQNHRSVNTPNDGIFLLGGIYTVTPPYVSTDQVYVADYHEKTLKFHSKMNEPRTAMGACYHKNAIYVVGGHDKNDESAALNTLEKLDLSTNKWTLLRRSNFNASGCALAPFNQRYLFKFGGKSDILNLTNKIEYYDIERDEWHNVYLPDQTVKDIQIPSDLSAIQINNSQILFYGGKVHMAKQSKAYVLQVKESSTSEEIDPNQFEIYQVKDMPVGAGSVTQPLLRDGQVLNFIDQFNMQDISVSFYNRKQVLQFNGSNWKQL